MRGRSMPKWRRRSRSMMRTMASSRPRSMAAGTSESARCVVASATRSPPPTSSITTSGVPVRSARYSVWPVKAMPASFNTLFCTGAVTIASNSPRMQPSMARSSIPSTCEALPLSNCPGTTGFATGRCNSDTTGAESRTSYRGASKAIERIAARRAITSRSPTITIRPGNFSRASRAHRSGPMPAGSPRSVRSGEAGWRPSRSARRYRSS